MNAEGYEALRRAGLSIQEYADALAALSVAASRVPPMPNMATIARMRLRRLYEIHGPLCVLTPSFWRWVRELVRPND